MSRIAGKGISPLLASVLLIAVTVAIATLVMGWTSTITRGTQTTVENKTTEAVNCAGANIVIDEVYVTSVNGTIGEARAVVRNVGETDDLVVTNVTYFNTSGISFYANGTPLVNFDKGAVFSFRFGNATTVPCPGGFSKVIATTNCGGITAIFDRTPKCF